MNANIGMKGQYSIVVYKSNGDIKQEVDWFDNLITNKGLDLYAGSAYSSIFSMYIGSGTIAPSFSDTQLGNLVRSSSNPSHVTTKNTSSPYDTTSTYTARFNPTGDGSVTQYITEVGCTNAGTSTNLFSRALIKDSNGTPISIALKTDEYLDLTYRIVFYPSLGDTTGSITLRGTTHTYISRVANVATNNINSLRGEFYPSSGYVGLYSGPIGLITGLPTTTDESSKQMPNLYNDTYTAGSYRRTGGVVIGLTSGNFTNGIQSMLINTSTGMQYQVGFTPRILKTSNDILTLKFGFSWGRS